MGTSSVMRIASVARVVVAVALIAGGCTRKPPATHTSLKDTAVAPAEEPAEDAVAEWCGERHADHQAGKAPGGAATLEKKQADDRTCGERYRYPGYVRPK